MNTRTLLTLGLPTLVFALTAGLDSSVAARTAEAPPQITSVAPASPLRGNSPMTVTVTGEGFLTGMKLNVTTPGGRVDSYQADAILGRTDTTFRVSLAFPDRGRYELVVINTDGGVSPPFAVETRERAPDGPVLSNVVPEVPAKRAEPQRVRVLGDRLAEGLTVIVTDPMGVEVHDAVPSRVTPTSFDLMVRLDKAGDYEVVVTNPSGAVSNVLRVPVR